MEFEESLQQLHAIMMIQSQATEERWLRDNCKAFAALKALLLPLQVLLVQLQVLLLPVQMQVCSYRTGPSEEDRNRQTGLQQQQRRMLRALNQIMLSSATPGARRARVELEPDEGKGEGESSRRLLGSSRTKFDALPLVWSPQGQQGN